MTNVNRVAASPRHQMGDGEEDEGAGEVDHVVHGQPHHQVVEVPPGAPYTEQQHAHTVTNQANAENEGLNILEWERIVKLREIIPARLPQSRTQTRLQE